ncbi:MAG: sulfotransferase [Halioglobus sp.]
MNSLRLPPAYIRLLNSAGRVLERAHLVKPELRVQELITQAQQRTGLHHWGDAAFKEGLEQLTTALKEQARLSQVGRIAAHFNLLDHLCVRLRLIDYRRKHAEVAEQQVRNPLFILGLPRSGTTILYELIAQDPQFRSPATWEVARPTPPPRQESYQTDRRIRSVDRLLGLMEKLSPGFRAIHAIGATLPQECVYLMASAFVSEQFGYMYDIPEYRAWVLRQDMSATYRWHAHFLQHLQVGLARDYWVLKSPAHLGALGYLFAEYPDARVVWTHRRPLDAITSFSSLTYALRSGFSSSIDPIATGKQEMQHFAAVVQRGMADRQGLASSQFFDASFNAICTDPLSVIRAIYRHFDLELSTDADRRMRDYLQRRPRDLYGEHHYSPATFGLNSAQEALGYSDYLARYSDWL